MLCLLGNPAFRTAEHWEPLRLRPKELALLARIALAPQPVRREELAAGLFPEADDPRGALRWHLSHLRSGVPTPLRRDLQSSSGAVLARIRTDVAEFRTGAARVRDEPGAGDDAEILALYRGDLCAGLTVSASPAFDTWLFAEQESLRRLFRLATMAHARWALAAGDCGSAVAPLSKLIGVDPYFEEAHVTLIHALELLEEPQAAARAYDLYQRIVRGELRAEPRPSLVRRYEGRPPTGPPLPSDDLVALSDVTIHTVTWPGAEPTILGIHGLAGSAHSLTALGERLAPEHRFIALDLRGHGFSDPSPNGYDLERSVDDVRQLIAKLTLVRPVVLGFSMGGVTAAAVATTCALGGLVLLEGAIGERGFLEHRSAETLGPAVEALDARFATVGEYLERWRAESDRYGDQAERWIDRLARFELAPLREGFRRRGLREALSAEVPRSSPSTPLPSSAGSGARS